MMMNGHVYRFVFPSADPPGPYGVGINGPGGSEYWIVPDPQTPRVFRLMEDVEHNYWLPLSLDEDTAPLFALGILLARLNWLLPADTGEKPSTLEAFRQMQHGQNVDRHLSFNL